MGGVDDIALVDELSERRIRTTGMTALLNVAAEAGSVLDREEPELLHREACSLGDCPERAWKARGISEESPLGAGSGRHKPQVFERRPSHPGISLQAV